MAGILIDRRIAPATRPAAGVEFRVATEADDTAIRRLLRENPMRGEITLSFEREPDYFRGARPGGADRTILAFEKGRLICLGRCSVDSRFVNGEPRRVGYLSELRLDASAQGRFDILRRGYRFFRELHRDDPPAMYFTSIASDNVRSIRFLERGLPGMPVYERLADFVTLLIPVRRRLDPARNSSLSTAVNRVSGAERSTTEIAACLNVRAQRYQLARVWTERDLRSLESLGLKPADFRLALDGARIVGCAALWDQRGFKQTVIRGYSPKLVLSRRCLNLAASLTGTPGLPPVNSVLAHGFLSPFVVDEQTDMALALVDGALTAAAERGLEFLTVGFAANDPRLALIRNRFRGREYLSRLYRVSWPEARLESHLAGRASSRAGSSVASPHQMSRLSHFPRPDELDSRLYFPEVAWL